MERDLIKFNEKVEIINKDLAKYEDEKGNMYIIPTGQLVCNCSYMELDKNEYKLAVFNQQVEDQEYSEIKIKRPSSKYERTKKEEDRWIIEDKELLIKQVWLVSNGLKISKSFAIKEDAIKYTEENNNEILSML